MDQKKIMYVTGMTCGSCESKIETTLGEIDGVESVKASHSTGQVKVELSKEIDNETLIDAVNKNPKYHASMKESADTPIGQPRKQDEPKESLYPLFLIVGYISLSVFLISLTTSNFEMSFMMRNFMAGFFLVFSFFKMLDIEGFADSFASYDVLAAKSRKWALMYPYVELGLGALYILNVLPIIVNLVTLFIMAIGAYGVLKTLLDKRSIQCACLGTALNLPMTKVTLVEDLVMAGMAFVALFVL